MTVRKATGKIVMFVAIAACPAALYIVLNRSDKARIDAHLVDTWLSRGDHSNGIVFYGNGKYKILHQNTMVGEGVWKTKTNRLSFQSLIDEDGVPAEQTCSYEIKGRDLYLNGCDGLMLRTDSHLERR